MGKITINELHKSLFDYVQTVSDNKLETNNKTIVGAINELFSDNSNDIEINNLKNEISNGKKLIADAIGEPLTEEDTFSAMSTDINGLLSTFKTNMMNAGTVVESGDKFKQLIDKIKGLTEGEGNKGIQYVEGTIESAESSTYVFTTVNGNTKSQSYAIIPNLPFEPIILILNVYDNISGRIWISILSYDSNLSMNTVKVGSFSENSETTSSYHFKADDSILTNDYIRMPIWVNKNELTFKYCAIGEEEGEGDTTLSGGLDIISATELPATGNNMQLCAITDNVTDSFILSNDEADVKISGTDIGIQLSELTMYDKYSYPMGGLTINLRIATTYQNASAIPLWLYYNNEWVQICSTKVIAINNKILQDGFTMGATNSYGYYGETAGLVLRPGSSANLFGFTPFNNTIDFSKYKAIRIKGTYKNTTGTYGPGIGIFGRSTNLGGGTSSGAGYGLSSTTSTFNALFSYVKTFNSSVTTSTPFDFTFEISKTNTCYLGIVTAMTEYTYITDLEFILK